MEKQKLMTTEAGTDAVKNDDPLVDNFHQYQACWDIIEGWVSPWCKEHIYWDWHLGMTIWDMSLKYGLLPEWVWAIVWQREYFWKEIYPKVGETGLRLGLELEFTYALDFPFVDYGKDLQHMTERERGAECFTMRWT